MSKHTPGPWRITNRGPLKQSYQHQIGTSERTVAYTWLPQIETTAEHEANARLIMAAPKLLAALKKLTDEYRAERDCLYDCTTIADGKYYDADDERAIAEMDAILDECRAVIAEAEVGK